MAFADPVNPVTVQYLIAFFAADSFYEEHARYPTEWTDEAALVQLAYRYADDTHLELGDDDRDKLRAACVELYVFFSYPASVARASTWHPRRHTSAALWHRR